MWLCFSSASPSLKFKLQANCHKNNPLLIFFFNSSIFDFVWFGFVCLFVLVFIFFNVWKKILSLPAIQNSWQTRFGRPTIICQLMLQKFLGL